MMTLRGIADDALRAGVRILAITGVGVVASLPFVATALA